MEKPRAQAHPRRKNVPSRLPLFIIALVVVGIAMLLADRLAQRRLKKQESPRAVAEAVDGAATSNKSVDAQLSETKSTSGEKGAAEKPAETTKLPSLKKTEIDFRKAEAYLGDVKDGTYGIIESGSLWLLKQAHDLPKEMFAPDPQDKEVSYSNLLEGPVLYRGKPVTVSGTVGRVSEFPAEIKELPGVKTMWVIEIFKPSKGQQAWVCTLLVSEDPGPLKIGYSEVRMKGYFYKLRSYEVEDEKEEVWIHQCPVVVGRYVKVVTKPVGPAPAGSLAGSRETVLVAATAIGLLVLMLIVLLFIRRFTARRGEYDARPQLELAPGELRQRREFLDHYVPGTRPGQPPDR